MNSRQTVTTTCDLDKVARESRNHTQAPIKGGGAIQRPRLVRDAGGRSTTSEGRKRRPAAMRGDTIREGDNITMGSWALSLQSTSLDRAKGLRATSIHRRHRIDGRAQRGRCRLIWRTMPNSHLALHAGLAYGARAPSTKAAPKKRGQKEDSGDVVFTPRTVARCNRPRRRRCDESVTPLDRHGRNRGDARETRGRGAPLTQEPGAP